MTTAPEPDPLAQITMRPRTFAAVLIAVAMLAGLILTLVPVHVAGPDSTRATSVTCGNVFGGTETKWVAEDLGKVDQATMVSYVDMCERGLLVRTTSSTLLFFGGLVGLLWMGVVRRRPGTQ